MKWFFENILVPGFVIGSILLLMIVLFAWIDSIDTPADQYWRAECMRVLEMSEVQCQWLDDHR